MIPQARSAFPTPEDHSPRTRFQFTTHHSPLTAHHVPRTTGAVYFFNPMTGATQWEKPTR